MPGAGGMALLKRRAPFVLAERDRDLRLAVERQLQAMELGTCDVVCKPCQVRRCSNSGSPAPCAANMPSATALSAEAISLIPYGNRVSAAPHAHGPDDALRQVLGEVVVGLGAAVAVELPGAADLFDHRQIAPDTTSSSLVFAGHGGSCRADRR